jgi:hypothetical protein
MIATQFGVLLRSFAVFTLAGIPSLLLGAWFVSAGSSATYRDSVMLYLKLAIFAVVVSGILLFAAAYVLAHAARTMRLFRHGARARTGWTAVVIAFLSAGIVGAATAGSDGFTMGMLAAAISGFPALALVAGILLGGDGVPSSGSDPAGRRSTRRRVETIDSQP